MNHENEVANFIESRKKLIEESNERQALVQKYRKNTPKITPQWNTQPEALIHNNIDEKEIDLGLTLYLAPFKDVWNGIYKPSIYDKKTLWKKVHEQWKIARVIDNWLHNIPLTPIIMIKHGTKDMGLILDGNHRFTVARYMDCENIPFWVQTGKDSWVSIAIPSAAKIGQIEPRITSPIESSDNLAPDDKSRLSAPSETSSLL